MDSSHSCWASRASSSRSRDVSESKSEVSRECTEPDMAASIQGGGCLPFRQSAARVATNDHPFFQPHPPRKIQTQDLEIASRGHAVVSIVSELVAFTSDAATCLPDTIPSLNAGLWANRLFTP